MVNERLNSDGERHRLGCNVSNSGHYICHVHSGRARRGGHVNISVNALLSVEEKKLSLFIYLSTVQLSTSYRDASSTLTPFSPLNRIWSPPLILSPHVSDQS